MLEEANLKMIEIVMPKSGVTMEEGTVVEWHYEVGSAVEKGEILLTIETDKSVLDVESPGSGILDQILVSEGETVAVGTPIGMIRE
jgi:pyruvate dehydrogenase E2 component (dihydrolipoamide acetyltransferase)